MTPRKSRAKAKPSTELEVAAAGAPVKVASQRIDGGPGTALAVPAEALSPRTSGSTHDIQIIQRPWKTITVDDVEYQFLLSQGLVYSGDPVAPVADGNDLMIADKIESGTATRQAMAAAVNDGGPFDLAQRAAFVPFWEAAETVTAGTIRMAPDGTTIERTADGTTRSTYDTTEQAAWTAKGSGGTTLTPATTAGDILVWDGDSYEPQAPGTVTASDVPFTPAGTLTATDVQAAIEQAASSGSGSSAVVGARIRLTANVTLAADGTQHQVPFNGQTWSYGGMTVDVTTNNNKIVVPVKGLYQWTGTAYPAAAAAGDRRLIARVNYANVGEIDEVRTTTAQEFQMTPSSFPILLNAGDTVTADFYATGGGNVILYGTNASFTWMSLVLIGTVP